MTSFGKLFKLSFVVILAYVVAKLLTVSKKNNVCTNFVDYFYAENNTNCYYNPDIDLTTPDIIKKYSGVVETHEVMSEDGYVVTMFRIPNEKPRGVILLHHSIAIDSRIYLFDGNDSLAITLWRNGFDVWLANQRGTWYSEKHKNLTIYDYKYWDYSFYEMGFYDVSSELSLIKEKTNGSKIIYFGHSLGATMGLIYTSLKPTEARDLLQSVVLLSPATHFKHRGLSLRVLHVFFKVMRAFTSFLNIGSPLLYFSFLFPISKVATRVFPPIIYMSVLFVWIFCGYTPEETNWTFFTYDTMNYVNDFSWKTVFTFDETIQEFTRKNYGTEENLKLYGSATPPSYPIEDIQVPTLIISSSNDRLIRQEDADEIFKKLSPEASVYGHWKYSRLNHLDFLIGKHRKEIFGDRLIDFLLKITTT